MFLSRSILYLLFFPLGTGGSGVVYELLHKTTGQRSAMKEMEIKNREQLKCATAEAQLLISIAKTISHPNIISIQKVFQVFFTYARIKYLYYYVTFIAMF